MSIGQVNLSELYKFDEIYWIPSDRSVVPLVHPSAEASIVILPDEEKVEVTTSSATTTIEFPVISTKWVILGSLPEEERQILKLVLSASPLNLTESDWSILGLKEFSSSFSDFIQNTGAKKYIFLGEFNEDLIEKFPKEEYVEFSDSKVLIFPRLLSSLGEGEKHIKLAFWNQLKRLLIE
jgi:hypothetical protein